MITNCCYIFNVFQSEIVHTLPKSSHVTKDTMAKLLIDFLQNQAKRHLRSTSDIDMNIHLYKGKRKGKEIITIETLNSESFKDAVFNNTEVMLTYLKYCYIFINNVFLEYRCIFLYSILCLLSSCWSFIINCCSFNEKC